MLCNIGKYNGKATGQCFSVLEKLLLGNRTMLRNIGKDDCKAAGNALQYWKRLWQGDGTLICDIGKYASMHAYWQCGWTYCTWTVL
jgi:hypothetical protein